MAFPVLAQYKYDNVLFRNVYLDDLCGELKKRPNALLIDVRTPGEFNDTSSYNGLNIGHLKGSINIPIRDFGARFKELPADKSRPVFVYCSHSQRSRRTSKMLADSGYTNVFNVNGGMTELNRIKQSAAPCLRALYETANSFALLDPRSACKLIASRSVFILDVRPDSAYNGISKNHLINAQGRLAGSTNIPMSALDTSLNKVPKNQTILLVDSYGDESIGAARLLVSRGYTLVNVLFNGLQEWLAEPEASLPDKKKLWIHPTRFGTLSTNELSNRLRSKSSMLLLDVRTAQEFTNQVKKETHLNRGHIQGALNIPLKELVSRLPDLKRFKQKEIIVYTLYHSPEAYSAAQILSNYGFNNVKVLTGGLWDVRWKAANTKSLAHLMQYVVDVPSDNQ